VVCPSVIEEPHWGLSSRKQKLYSCVINSDLVNWLVMARDMSRSKSAVLLA